MVVSATSYRKYKFFLSWQTENRVRSLACLLYTSYLGGNTTYYRYHNGERLLTPEQQEWIINLFRRHGYTDELRFDEYRDLYDFILT